MTDGTITPDDKDWTWVLQRPCPECGFAATTVAAGEIAARIRDTTAAWREVLARGDVARRPAPAVWSPLEYACHVRDVHRTMGLRLGLILDQDGATFPNWDQDATAVAERYAEQDPAVVAAELDESGEQAAARYDAVPDDAWGRRGVRSNGSVFTALTLGRYHLHDVVHHLRDVAAAEARA